MGALRRYNWKGTWKLQDQRKRSIVHEERLLQEPSKSHGDILHGLQAVHLLDVPPLQLLWKASWSQGRSHGRSLPSSTNGIPREQRPPL